jgi:MoaA/NifB/PqqE/SkfB family radical SAM enzyme
MLNYVGIFLTFNCGLGCDYCLNKQGDFKPREEITPADWLEKLSAVENRNDLPLSIQGGEPTAYDGFYWLMNKLHKKKKYMDLLTNGCFDLYEFMSHINKNVFRRDAPYASIRFSFHKNSNEDHLINTIRQLNDEDYSVGVWGISHPDMKKRNVDFKARCEEYGIDYREKEYLDDKHGTYKYSEIMSGRVGKCLCKSSEILFAPDGKIHRCHRDLYAGINGGVSSLDRFEVCEKPKCNSCDTKIKTNRFQVGGHTSVEIRNLDGSNII